MKKPRLPFKTFYSEVFLPDQRVEHTADLIGGGRCRGALAESSRRRKATGDDGQRNGDRPIR
jgi:hypothetical protein